MVLFCKLVEPSDIDHVAIELVPSPSLYLTIKLKLVANGYLANTLVLIVQVPGVYLSYLSDIIFVGSIVHTSSIVLHEPEHIPAKDNPPLILSAVASPIYVPSIYALK
nr:MAG TPA: hypothetical protein [Bacteriophage sp.]